MVAAQLDVFDRGRAAMLLFLPKCWGERRLFLLLIAAWGGCPVILLLSPWGFGVEVAVLLAVGTKFSTSRFVETHGVDIVVLIFGVD